MRGYDRTPEDIPFYECHSVRYYWYKVALNGTDGVIQCILCSQNKSHRVKQLLKTVLYLYISYICFSVDSTLLRALPVHCIHYSLTDCKLKFVTNGLKILQFLLSSERWESEESSVWHQFGFNLVSFCLQFAFIGRHLPMLECSAFAVLCYAVSRSDIISINARPGLSIMAYIWWILMLTYCCSEQLRHREICATHPSNDKSLWI